MTRKENQYNRTLQELERRNCKITPAPENGKSNNYALCMFVVLFVLSLMGLTNRSIAGIGLMMYILCENLNGLVRFGVTIAIAHLYFTRKMVGGLMAIVLWIICIILEYIFFPIKCECCGKDDNNCFCIKPPDIMKYLQEIYDNPILKNK